MRVVLACLLICIAAPLSAGETITYTYDAKGRLILVVHAGTVNNGATSTYTHDPADNRKKKKTTGAP